MIENPMDPLVLACEIESLRAKLETLKSRHENLRSRADEEIGALHLQNGEWEKLVHGAADTLYAIGKDLRSSGDGTGHDLMVIATNLHRQCQIIKGEEPLPVPGERLTEKRKCQHVFRDYQCEKCGVGKIDG